MNNPLKQTAMKRFIYSALALVALAGCAKDVIPAEELVPQGETVTITAAMAETKSTESSGAFEWNSDETISVGTADAEYVAFDVDNAEAGTFKHTFDAAAPELLLAVSPAQATATFGDASIYEVELPAVYSNYVQGQTNALMIGIPDAQTANKFIFSHAAALVKVTYANVPAGTAGFKFEADANITGTVTLGGTSISDIEISNTNTELNGREVYINLAQPVAENGGTLSFYVPVPTGDYSLLTISLLDANGQAIENSVKTMNREGKTPLTLARTDVFTFPTITLEDVTKYYVKVTSNDELVNGQYLIVYEEGSLAFNGGLSTLDAVGNSIEVVIDNNKIESTETTDAASFTISIDDGTIQSASGYYIGQTSDANGLATSTTSAYTNSTSFNDKDVEIVSSKAHLRYNSAANQTRFRYYKSSSYTGQKAIALYFLEGSATASKQPSGLAWSASTATASITDDGVVFTAPTLTLGNAHDVTYSSSNTTVATIDAEGVVTVKAEGETTIKASFAGDDTYKASTVEYVLTVTDERTNYEFTTIAELRALATSTTAVTAYGTLTNAVVSYVPNTGNAIIKDATGSVLYYKSGHGLKQGQTYTGDLTITVKLYNTFAEITSITGAAFTGNQAAVDPEVVTLSDLIGNFATYQSTYVKLEGLTVSSVSGKNVTVTDGTNSYAVYSSAADATCSEGDIVTIIGTVSHHGDADQIQVWSTDSIIVTQAHDGGDVTVTKTMTAIVSDNDYTVSSGSNVTCYTSFNLDSNITVSTSGDENCGSFWAQSSGSSNYEWRLYQNKSGDITITAETGHTISSVNVTFTNSNNGTLLNGSNAISSGKDISVNASSITFTVSNSGNATNGQIKIRSISVTYN